jgi:hypothetical protein
MVMIDVVVLAAVLAVGAGVRRALLMRERSASPRSSVPLGQIHPAVADLLVNRGEPSPGSAHTAALALARSDRRLNVEERDGIAVLRLREEAEGDPRLRPFEELVLQRVRQRMGDRSDYVPAAALGPGDGSAYTRWRSELRRSLLDEAVTQGLMHRDRHGKVRMTTAGIRAALWWRRRIAPAPRFMRLERRLEARAGWPRRWPRDIWSSSGGAWHLVPTAALRRPAWGAVWNLVLLALAAAGALTIDLVYPRPHQATVGAAVGILTLATAGVWLPAGRRIRRAPVDAAFRGTVICRFDNEWWDENSAIVYTSYHCSVEDPAAGQAWTFKYAEARRPLFGGGPPPVDDRFHVGDIVDVHCNPRRRALHRMERVAPALRGSGSG